MYHSLVARFLKVYVQKLFDAPIVHYKAYSNQSKPFVCFDRVTMGMAKTGLHQSSGLNRGFEFRSYRDKLLARYDVRPKIRCDHLQVIFHDKKGRRRILNPEAVRDHLLKNLPSFNGIPVNLSLLTVDDLETTALLQTMADADIFISSGGSALFLSILMHDNTVTIANLIWFMGRDDPHELLDFELPILTHIPYVRTQVHPLSMSQVNDTLSGSTWNVDDSLREFRQAVHYAYHSKRRLYCPNWKA